MMKITRVNKTLTVDPVKITLFEETKKIHGINISDFLDQKLEEFLTIHAPDEIQRMKIQKLNDELRDAEETLRNIEFMMNQRKTQQKKKEVEESKQEITYTFFENYEFCKDSLASMINRKLEDWKQWADVYKFKDKAEAEAVIKEALQKEGLLGCRACKKWSSKTKFCSTYKKNTSPDYSCRNWGKR